MRAEDAAAALGEKLNEGPQQDEGERDEGEEDERRQSGEDEGLFAGAGTEKGEIERLLR